jgi:hypothetical protein
MAGKANFMERFAYPGKAAVLSRAKAHREEAAPAVQARLSQFLAAAAHHNLYTQLNGAAVLAQGRHGLFILANTDRGDGFHGFHHFSQTF